MNETIKLLNNHRSIRKFKDIPIEEDILKTIIKSGQCAPTSTYRQAYTVIRVKDRENRKEIAKLSGEQKYIEEAPEFLVFCPDLRRLSLACEMNGTKSVDGLTETFMIATIDAAIMAQSVYIAAESLGLGGVYIGGIRNNPQRISEILGLPENMYPAFGMCLGYPNHESSIKPRLPMEVIFKEDRYNSDEDRELLEEYDKAVSQYYFDRTKGNRNDTWTSQMATSAEKELRPHMKEFLRSKGLAIK